MGARACLVPQAAVAHKGLNVLWIITTILLILVLLIAVTAGALGGFIHLLLIVAIGTVLAQLLQSRRAV